jgi:hypothetical protein
MSALRASRVAGFGAALSAALVVGMAGTAGGGKDDDVADAATVATTPAAAPTGDGVGDHGCPDFDTQAEAQAVLKGGDGDRERLDADDDGIACEQHFGTEGRQVAVFPLGGVATGGSPRQ